MIGIAYRSTSLPCKCQNGYYEDGINIECYKCKHPCVNCSSDIICTTCKIQPNRSTTPPCLCNDGYYEDPTTKECKKCEHPCQNCTENPTNCTLCVQNSLLENHRKDAPNCSCKQGYYEENSTKLCKICEFPC